MLCFRYKKLLMPYMENALDEKTRNRVMHHVVCCKRCAADLRVLESMSQALSQVDVPSADPAQDLWAKVSTRIANENISSVASRRSWIPQAATGILAVLIVGGYMLTRPAVQLETTQTARSKSSLSISKNIEPPITQQLEQTAKAIQPNAPSPTHKSTVKPHHQKPIMMAKLPSAENKVAFSGSKPKDTFQGKNDYSAKLPSSPEPLSESKSRVAISETAGSSMSVSDSSSKRTARSGNVFLAAPMACAVPQQSEYDSAKNTLDTGFSAKVDMEKKDSLRNQLLEAEKAGNYAGTVSSASRLIRLDPENAPYYYTHLGFAYAHLGDNAGSVKMYSHALDYGSSDTYKATAVSIKNAGMLPSLKEQYAEKFKINNQPAIGSILFELQSASDDKIGMLRTAKELLKTDANNPDYLLKLGDAYQRCGKVREARDAYEKAVSCPAKSKLNYINK